VAASEVREAAFEFQKEATSEGCEKVASDVLQKAAS